MSTIKEEQGVNNFYDAKKNKYTGRLSVTEENPTRFKIN
jgi:hypothetical protein